MGLLTENQAFKHSLGQQIEVDRRSPICGRKSRVQPISCLLRRIRTLDIMKLARWLCLTTLTALGFSLTTSYYPSALAANFTATEVDQNRYVLLANAGGSRLTILEQIANTRPCWQERGNEVDVLLLNFDFTDICGRYSDLNGYSVRAAGQDLGLLYRLQVIREANAMVLYAVPREAGTALEIGRTGGLPDEFGRIYLNPGWRLTRRIYNGQTVGHIYLTSDQSEARLIANAGGRPTAVATQPRPHPVPSTPRPTATVPAIASPSPRPNTATVNPPSHSDSSPRRSRGLGNILNSLFRIDRIDIHFSINTDSASSSQNSTNFVDTSQADAQRPND